MIPLTNQKSLLTVPHDIYILFLEVPEPQIGALDALHVSTVSQDHACHGMCTGHYMIHKS